MLPDGEEIWSATRESPGGTYRGAAADVAERIAEDLEEALAAAREQPPAAKP